MNHKKKMNLRYFFYLTCDELISTLNEFLSKTYKVSAKYKNLKKVHFILTVQISWKRSWHSKREKSTLNSDILKSPKETECNFVKYESIFQEFLENDIVRSKQANMIYGVSRNNK